MAAGVDTLVPVLNALPRASEIPLTNAKGAFSRSRASAKCQGAARLGDSLARVGRQPGSVGAMAPVFRRWHGVRLGSYP